MHDGHDVTLRISHFQATFENPRKRETFAKAKGTAPQRLLHDGRVIVGKTWSLTYKLMYPRKSFASDNLAAILAISLVAAVFPKVCPEVLQNKRYSGAQDAQAREQRACPLWTQGAKHWHGEEGECAA